MIKGQVWIGVDGKPYALVRGWWHRWVEATRSWSTLRPMLGTEFIAPGSRRLSSEEAALYGIKDTEFKRVEQPNNYSCFACAAAMAVGETLADVIAFVGHDGSALHPTSAHPDSHIGFQFEEIAGFLLSRHMLLGAIISLPGIKVGGPGDYIPVRLPCTNRALVVVDSETLPPPVVHVVYWDGRYAHDPSPTSREPRHLSEYTVREWHYLTELGDHVNTEEVER